MWEIVKKQLIEKFINEVKNKNYGEVSQLKNRVGEWTHFYRNATDESNIPVGKHELKTIRLKTNDKRKK